LNRQPLQFKFADRELLLDSIDLLTAPVEVIVNPANSGLTIEGGLATQIYAAVGDELQTQSRQLIREYTQFESGMAVYTEAGNLSYKAIIHAVGPTMGEGDEQYKIEQTILRSLQLCEINNWHSIAFPAISTGHCHVPVVTCAKAMFKAITHFWDARHECVIDKIMICLVEKKYQIYVDAFTDGVATQITTADNTVENVKETDEPIVGEVSLSDDDIADLENNELDDWFSK